MAMSPPANAGPMSRETELIVLLVATALGSNSTPTSWNRMACIAGRSTASTRPSIKVSA